MKFFLFILMLFSAKSGFHINAQKADFSILQEVNTSVSPYFSALQHDYDVKFYFIDLEISNTSTYIQGRTSILVESIKSNLDTLVFELSNTLSIDSLHVNSQNISHFVFSSNLIKIPLPESLKNESLLNTSVFYQGYAGSGGFFSGVTSRRESKYDKWVTYTLSEPFQAKNWFPCKQDLTDKADSAWIFLTVNNNLKAGSNGILTGLSPVGEDKTRFEWKTNYPITYYLLSFSVSDYQEYTFHVNIPGTDHSMPVQNYLYNHPSLPGNEKENIDVTEDLLILYSDLLGIYPFFKEKYGHCLAPMGGGMEHQTMTTLTHFNFALVAHELAHQWYGNYLTCKTWQDIWINEGFASYLEYIAIEKLRTKEDAKTWIESAQNSAKAFPEGSVYIYLEDAFNVNRIFNMELSYKKGALILHMLRFELDNDSLFFGILKDFLSSYAFGVASGADFIEFLNSTTGEDYNWFFNQWYYGKGYPLFLASWSQSHDSLIIKSIQETSSSTTPFFRTMMDYKLVYTDGSEEILRLNHVKIEERFTFYTDKVIDYIIADPENIIIKNAVVLKQVTANQLFEVSPNPFFNKLTIRFLSAGENRLIRINALNGKQVFETLAGSGSFSYDFSFLKPGVYILSVSDGKNDYSVKIVKSSKPGS